MSSRVAVFYAGRVVEIGESSQVLRDPRHPYTQALLSAMPTAGKTVLASLPGQPPDLTTLGGGCAFAERCPVRCERADEDPHLVPIPQGDDHQAACWRIGTTETIVTSEASH